VYVNVVFKDEDVSAVGWSMAKLQKWKETTKA
jgi:hypothetical protein